MNLEPFAGHTVDPEKLQVGQTVWYADWRRAEVVECRILLIEPPDDCEPDHWQVVMRRIVANGQSLNLWGEDRNSYTEYLDVWAKYSECVWFTEDEARSHLSWYFSSKAERFA